MLGRLLVFIGLIFIITGATVLGFVQSVHIYEFSRQVVAEFVCEPGERITFEQQRFEQAFQNFRIVYYCEDNEGQRREINAQLSVVGTFGFMIPFAIGMLMVMAGILLVRRERHKKMLQSLGGGNMPSGTNFNFSQAKMSPSQQAQVGQILQSMTNTSSSSANPSTTLAERLKQLEDAYEQGLITEDEYQKARQAILDNPNG